MVGPSGEQRLHPELEQLPGRRGALGVRGVGEDLLDHEAAVAVGAVVGEGFGREVARGAQFQRVLHPRRPRGAGGPPAAGAALAQPPGRQPGSGGSAHRPAAPSPGPARRPGGVPAACTRGAAPGSVCLSAPGQQRPPIIRPGPAGPSARRGRAREGLRRKERAGAGEYLRRGLQPSI